MQKSNKDEMKPFYLSSLFLFILLFILSNNE